VGAIGFITIPEMHHDNMPSGSGLWHFLYRLVHKFIRPVVNSEKDVATTSRNRNRKTHYYDAFREWRMAKLPTQILTLCPTLSLTLITSLTLILTLTLRLTLSLILSLDCYVKRPGGQILR